MLKVAITRLQIAFLTHSVSYWTPYVKQRNKQKKPLPQSHSQQKLHWPIHACNPNTREAKVRELPQILGQPGFAV